MTEAQYIEQVDLVSSRLPKHPLLPSLLKGHSRANEIYLKRALSDLSAVAMAPIGEQSTELKRFFVKKSALFGKRDRLSNQMCDLPEDAKYDAQRAGFSDQIQAVQRDIEAVMIEIAAIERGEQPTVVADAPDLPTDRAGLILKRQSLRSSISRKKGKRDQSKDKASRERHEAVLQKLTLQLTHVESALENKAD